MKLWSVLWQSAQQESMWEAHFDSYEQARRYAIDLHNSEAVVLIRHNLSEPREGTITLFRKPHCIRLAEGERVEVQNVATSEPRNSTVGLGFVLTGR